MVSKTERKALTYRHFWEMRGMQSLWVTQHISYRIGAVVAMCAYYFRISPNILSLFSGALTVGAALATCGTNYGEIITACMLLIGLQLGFVFDCADGPLARAIGQNSSFGLLLDKIVDLSSGMLFVCILGYVSSAAKIVPMTIILGFEWPVLVFFLTVRSSLSVWLWLKESIFYKTDRLRKDERKKGGWWRMKKGVGLYIDEPVYRFAIATAWIFGYFWDFIIIYGFGLLIVTLTYIISSKNEMDAMDRSARASS